MASWMVHLRIADELLKAIDPMRKIKKKNYRLLIDAILDVETKTKIGKPVFFFCHKEGVLTFTRRENFLLDMDKVICYLYKRKSNILPLQRRN